jgi:carbonic anhydrase
MANIEALIEQNATFVATRAYEGTTNVPRLGLFVITCVDPRTDPSAFFGLRAGDAMVIRNAGGRVSSEALKDLAFVCHLNEHALDRVPDFEVAVIQHTQCGTRWLAEDAFRHSFANRIDAEEEAALAAAAVTDPERTVRLDVERILSAESLPRTISVSGHIYDVATGRVTTVVPTVPMPTNA